MTGDSCLFVHLFTFKTPEVFSIYLLSEGETMKLLLPLILSRSQNSDLASATSCGVRFPGNNFLHLFFVLFSFLKLKFVSPLFLLSLHWAIHGTR